jgi:hypothetical protein
MAVEAHIVPQPAALDNALEESTDMISAFTTTNPRPRGLQ